MNWFAHGARVLGAGVVLGAIIGGCGQGPDPEGESTGSASESATRCPTGENLCGNACVNLATDPRDCGACGQRCGSSRACVAGKCVPTCPAGMTICAGVCVSESTDVHNCGACGHGCPAVTGGVATCTAGVCGGRCTTAGASDCSGLCVNELTDVHNCGSCGHTCPSAANATAACSSGQCTLTCNAGLVLCPGAAGLTCVSLQADPANCGACGQICPSGQVCSAGACL